MERLHRDRTAVGLGVAGHDDAVRIDARCHDIGEAHVVPADRRGDQHGVLVGAALAEPARFAVRTMWWCPAPERATDWQSSAGPRCPPAPRSAWLHRAGAPAPVVRPRQHESPPAPGGDTGGTSASVPVDRIHSPAPAARRRGEERAARNTPRSASCDGFARPPCGDPANHAGNLRAAIP